MIWGLERFEHPYEGQKMGNTKWWKRQNVHIYTFHILHIFLPEGFPQHFAKICLNARFTYNFKFCVTHDDLLLGNNFQMIVSKIR